MRKIIESYPNYFVSDDGRILSVARGALRELGLDRSNAGYLRTQLYRDGVAKHPSVHRLVAEAFIPNPTDKPHVNHINLGDKRDNRASNEWCTRSENMQHAISNGLLPEGSNRGEKHGNAKLTKDAVLEIRSLKGKLSGRLIAARYRVSLNTVALIWARKVWSWL